MGLLSASGCCFHIARQLQKPHSPTPVVCAASVCIKQAYSRRLAKRTAKNSSLEDFGKEYPTGLPIS